MYKFSSFRPIFENSEIAKLVNENFIFWVQPSDHGAEGKEGIFSSSNNRRPLNDRALLVQKKSPWLIIEGYTV